MCIVIRNAGNRDAMFDIGVLALRTLRAVGYCRIVQL
nr:MAG TPA: hypothetical protein [Caudoviricetes sp.]